MREKIIKFGILNIKIIERNKQTLNNYIDLLKFIIERKIDIKIRGTKYALLYGSEELEDDCIVIYGVKYTEIDKNKPWFDRYEIKILKDEKGKPIPVVPSELKANTEDFYLLFFPEFHRIVYNLEEITHSQIERLFSGLQHHFPNQFEFYLEKDRKNAREIINKSKFIRDLFIKISLPNKDELGEMEEKIIRELERKNIDNYELEEKSNFNKLIIGEEEKALINISNSYGFAKARIKENGELREISTKEKPIEESFKFNPYGNKSLLSELYENAKRILLKLFRKQ